MTRFVALILVLATCSPLFADDAAAALALAAARRAADKGEAKAAPPCVCGDACKCAPGVCPLGCPVAKSAPTDRYAAACAAVSAGRKVVILLGDHPTGPYKAFDADAEFYPVDSLKGFEPGVYDCWKDASGRNVMQRREVVSARGAVCTGPNCAQQGAPAFTLPAGGCANGTCGVPQQTRGGFFRR